MTRVTVSDMKRPFPSVLTARYAGAKVKKSAPPAYPNVLILKNVSKRGLACARAMLPIQKDFAHSGHHLHVMTEQKYNTIIDWLSRTLFAVVTEGTAMS